MVKNLILSLAASLLLHGFVAFALIAYLEHAPRPDVLAMLDLSSVELSFAETVEESAAVAPAPEIMQQKVRPFVAERPPAVKPEKPLPPDPSAPKFPEPKEEPQTLRPSNPQASQPAPRQARIDAPPKPKRSIKPDYPKGARQRGEQGDVVLEIRVNAEGTVDTVKVAVSSGFGELDEAAAKAAKAAKFKPARSGREPVASTARLKLQFKLR